MLMTAEILRRLEGMRIELEAQAMQQGTLLDKLKSTPREKVVYALSTASPDPVLTALLEQKNLAEQSLIAKQKEFGSEHPEVVKTRSQVEDIKSKINEQVDGIMLGLDSRVSAAREQLKRLNEEVEMAKQNDIATVRKAKPYFEAKRELRDAEQFSQVLAMKVASEKIEAALPKSMSVEIMDTAGVPGRPIYPNRAQAAALILFGILFDFAGLRMIKMKSRFAPVLQPA
jgi:uncharacterized protein involved in exopolysaccharide biosynthesis